MAQKDLAEKGLERHNAIFADILNGGVFGGEQAIDPNALHDMDTQVSFYDGTKLRELRRDVVKLLDDEVLHLACIGLENQSSPDPDMPFRVIGYDGANYEAQCYRGGKHYPVITLVVYFNYKRTWKGPLTLGEAVTVSPRFKPLFRDYGINLISVADMTREQVNRFKSDFKVVADFFVQKKQTNHYEPPKGIKLAHPTDTLRMLDTFGHTNFASAFNLDDPEGVPDNMYDIVNEFKKRGTEETTHTQAQYLISTLEQRFPDFPDSLKNSIRQVTDSKKLIELSFNAGSAHSLDEIARQLAV